MRILVTGANGFVGRRLLEHLAADPRHAVRAAARRAPGHPDPRVEHVVVPDITESQGWADAVADMDCVIHLAARVHVLHERAADPWQAFERSNVQGTADLARLASESGVRRFVFMSTVKVHGERTSRSHPFTEDQVPEPQDPYGRSKLLAERALHAIADQTPMEFVCIRPPLVYGPGAGANFAALVRVVRRGLPLPLRAVDNRRSLIAVDNLVDVVACCAEHPAAANRTFLVSDGEDLSTPQLVSRMARAMGRQARLFAFPPALLLAAARLVGQELLVRRLCDDLQVDASQARAVLGWAPPISVDEGLRRCVADEPGR